MPRWKTAVVVLALVAPVVALLLLRGPLNTWYAKEEGAITAVLFLISCYTLLFQSLYLTQEWFYLAVRRVILFLRPSHSYWRLKHRLDTLHETTLGALLTPQSELRKTLDESVSELAWGRVISNHGGNYLEWVIDDRDRVKLDVDVDEEGAAVSTSKLLVPSSQYKSIAAKLNAICQEIERQLKPKEIQSSLEFSFPHANPYFGFFISKVPADLITSFRCVFKTNDSAGRKCVVTATEREIFVSGASRDAISEVALSYLTLSATLLRGSN